jgi:hypothetical protein
VIISPNDFGLDLLASDLVRSPGLHASTVFGDLFESLDPKRYVYDSPPNPVSLAMGTAWEAHLLYLLVKNGIEAVRPSEYLSPEGIAYSPDLVIFNGIIRCGEIKWTSKSAKGLPSEPTNHLDPKYDRYMCQLMLYIYWLRIEFDELVQGWLALALMHEAWDPQFRGYNVDFTERELSDNYLMCMNHAYNRGMLRRPK